MSSPLRRFPRPVPTDPLVGEAYEKALETMVNLARRIEKVKTEHESFKKMEGGNYMTPREKNERLAAIRTSIRWLIAQCRGFARNRGNEFPLIETMDKIKRRAVLIRKSGRPVAARDFWITETTSELERWLEENRLLINITDPDRDLTEEAWEQMIREAVQNYHHEHPVERKDTEDFDQGLEDLADDNEDDGDDAEEGDEDGVTDWIE